MDLAIPQSHVSTRRRRSTNETEQNYEDDDKVPTGVIVASHRLYSFTMFLIEITRGEETWHILRRYSWFLSVYEQLKQMKIDLPCEFPTKNWLSSSADEVCSESRKDGLQQFLDLLQSESLSTHQCVASFLYPIRTLHALDEQTHGYKWKTSTTRLYFMDPILEGDCITPRILIGHGATSLVPLYGLTTLNLESDEKIALRGAIQDSKKKKSNEIDRILIPSFAWRLRAIHAAETGNQGELSSDDLIDD